MKAGIRSDAGYAMIALLVAMSVMAVMLSVALPVYSTQAKREKEAELVFRGQQYARAIMLFQRKYGNALPPNVDVLVNERFLRKKYKDPITDDDFVLLGPTSPELQNALPAGALGQQQGNRGGQTGTQGRGSQQTTQGQGPRGGMSTNVGGLGGGSSSGFSQSGFQTASGRSGASGNAPGGGAGAGMGIMGVTSKSKDTSMRLWNGHDKYNEWIFVAVQTSTQAGGPGGAAGAQGRGRQGGARQGGARQGGTSPFGGQNQPGPFGGPRGGGMNQPPSGARRGPGF